MNKQSVVDLDHSFTPFFQAWAAILAGATLVFGFLGLGIPQHYYQPLFAGLTLAVLYRHNKINLARSAWKWPLVIANFLMLMLLYKLLIGGGISHPLDWLKIPDVVSGSPPPNATWHDKILPNLKLEMKPVPALADWSIDITKFQTLFLIATLAGAVFRFQPFASFAAMGLLLISIPTLASFNWDWVILFLVCCSSSFYFQSPVGAKANSS